MGSYTLLRIHSLVESFYIWAESTSCRSESRNGKRRVTSESDWKKYYGSNDQLKSDVKEFGKEHFTRKILSVHETVGKTNYAETEALFKNNVLRAKLKDGTAMFYNDNILREVL